MSDAWRESEPQRRLDAKLAVIAAAQHGPFTLAQLKALGLPARTVQRRAAAGRLHRIHHGVYALTPRQLLTYRGRLMAAVLACGEGAVLSHRSAADLLGLRSTARAGIDVTARTHRRIEGVDIHRSRTLTRVDLTLVDRIPCTTVARTQLDLCDVVPLHQVERALNQADVTRWRRIRHGSSRWWPTYSATAEAGPLRTGG